MEAIKKIKDSGARKQDIKKNEKQINNKFKEKCNYCNSDLFALFDLRICLIQLSSLWKIFPQIIFNIRYMYIQREKSCSGCKQISTLL